MPPVRATPQEYVAWILAASALCAVLLLHLTPGLLAGLLVCELVRCGQTWLARRWGRPHLHGFIAALLILLVLALLGAGVIGIVAFVRSEGGSLGILFERMATIIDATRHRLPGEIADALPRGAGETADVVTHWLRTHALEVERFGRQTLVAIGHTLAGVVVGILLALHLQRPRTEATPCRPLTRALAQRAKRFAAVFRRVVFAQMRISAINALLTGVYLAIILPLCGIHLPLVKTMIVVTLFVGMVPVLGNLVSNSIIFVVSLAHSPGVALASLLFLIVIHKFE